MATPGYGFATSFEIIGTNGIIQFNSQNAPPLLQHGQSEKIPSDPYTVDGYYLEMDAFIQCILKNQPPLISGEIGRKAVAMCIAAIKSATEGRKISLKEVLQ